MAKGFPSFRIGRCFGISINSSPATCCSIPIPAALRASAESGPRWPLSPTSLAPSSFRSAHSQREWQPFGRIAYNNATNAPTCAWRHPLPLRNPCADRINTPLTPRIAIHNAKCTPTWPARPWQHRFYSGSSDGNASRCSCGKEIAVSPTRQSKTTQDLQKVKASTLNETAKDASKQSPDQPKQDASASDSESIASYMSYLHLPRMPHRPTKEELLEAANGFWERLKAAETLARWVGDYLTQSAGVTVVFESAIVPKWRDGVISFRNVFVSRRPGQGSVSSVSKGSSDAAAEAAAGRQANLEKVSESEDEEDDGNYTQFDVTFSTVNVTLSFLNWWNGKGLLKDVEIKGVRGVIDRTSVTWPIEELDPLSYRHKHQPGDFEIEKFKMEDLLLTVHQPGGFRPFSVSIFSCELPQLRKQWLFYDFLSANHMSGSFDGSLFTIHPRQVHGVIPSGNGDPDATLGFGDPKAWKKFSRLRIDGLKIDHLNRGVEGPFGWIYEGNVDIVADVMFPADTDESITKVMTDFYDQLEEVVISNRHRFMRNIQEQGPALLTRGHLSDSAGDIHGDIATEESQAGEDERRYLIMDLRIHLNDVKAAVPLFTKDMSYVNQALVRPIVAYINAKKTYIPINCRIVKRASDFDGSWSIFDCGLMNDMSAETYDAFARDVENQQSRVRRFKKVGFWTLSLAVHALFMGMAGNVV
ncbi:hypothetical protein MRS44_000510 [Fusarium solani]|uniref:uncharacterized protein n=1 Tax=Fusarium solani TaxID=169388 RepID=UPI0032C3EB0A|nr:hypothetical protein MRS44_000510 [Fusarium solani]